MLLRLLLIYFKPQSNETTYDDALMYAWAIVTTMVVSILTINQTLFESFHVGGKVRAAVCSLVYRKVILIIHF